MQQRKWHHDETPLKEPSAAAYRTGCRCPKCRQLHNDYMKAWRRGNLETYGDTDGARLYHTHKGQPSPQTAVKWKCTHPRCLDLAGLHLDPDGIVRETSNGTMHPAFQAAA